MEQVKILNPFKDSQKIRLGLAKKGLRRKVFGIIDKERVGANNAIAVMES